MTGTALENSENYHVSGFTSGSFHAVSTVCPRSPNVERRGSELHQFLQRPDGRLHLTKRVHSKAIGLRVTTCPPFCRNFDVMRRHSRKSTASTTCDLRRDNPCTKAFLGPRIGYVTPFRGGAAAWTHSCVPGLSQRKTVASSFSGPRMCRAFSRAHVAIVEANTLPTCDVRGR